jgi:ribonuclease Z
MSAFDIILLGTGSPMPSPNRCGAGQLVAGREANVLIDCGWGAARRLMATGIPLASVNTIFFTHMHSDHITDLPDLIIMRWTAGATEPLTIYGPEGTREMVEGFRAGLAPDIRYRFAHHGEKLSHDGIECIVHEVAATPDVSHVASVGGLAVGAFEVDHRPVVPALGFRVDADGASAVFSGDTKRCESLGRAARGADVLVSEALHLGMMGDRISFLRAQKNERMAVILQEACEYHTPTLELAALARDAAVGRLVITHVIPPIADEGPQAEAFVAGMSELYTGEILLGRDLQRISVGA